MQYPMNDIIAFQAQILNWYDRHRRDLPWRAKQGEIPDPYRVWLSEIMLQQTTVQAVRPYFLRFTEKWPSVFDLAAAPQDDLMQEWAGLGYYARARNLHTCAKQVVELYDGVFPHDIESLRTLPGIGDYTSAAIASIAFDRPANVVDGNVERVMARYFNEQQPMPHVKPLLKSYAAQMCAGIPARHGDYAQALMDLGATICTPKSPLCSLCPVNSNCASYKFGNPAELPRKNKKALVPRRAGYVYLIKNKKGEILVQKRHEKGLLGGMMGLPTSEWLEDSAKCAHPFRLEYQMLDTHITHVFTHFYLTLHLFTATVDRDFLPFYDAYVWVSHEEFLKMKFPTVFSKAKKIFISATEP